MSIGFFHGKEIIEAHQGRIEVERGLIASSRRFL